MTLFLVLSPHYSLRLSNPRCMISLANETQQHKNRHFQTWLPNFSLTQPVISCVTFNKLLNLSCLRTSLRTVNSEVFWN